MFAAPVYEQYRYLHSICSWQVEQRNQYQTQVLQSLNHLAKDRQRKRKRRNTDTQTEREIEYTETITHREGDRRTKKIRNAQGHREGKRLRERIEIRRGRDRQTERKRQMDRQTA